MDVSLEVLRRASQAAKEPSYVEVRFHSRLSTEITVTKGELEEASSARYSGVGVRVLLDGAWGFSSTNTLTWECILKAVEDAASMAKVSSRARRTGVSRLAECRVAKGRFQPGIDDPLTEHDLEEKVKTVLQTEAAARGYSPSVKSAICSYKEILDTKMILTSDGAEAEIFDSKPEFRVTAVASGNDEMVAASESVGVTGGWRDLFREKVPQAMAEKASITAIRLLEAKKPRGERATVILDPGMVGLISHEAVGHTVEADFVLSGSIARGKIGQRVASDLVTLVDSGPSQIKPCAAGTVFVDDEGVEAGRTVIIDRGVLVSYLHSRETAALFGVEPTGNARAFEYSDEPIIRMRNTFIEPGGWSYEEMVKDVDRGYLLKGPRSGQADANGEFMFGAQEAYLIEGGEVTSLLRGVTISGRAFDVLMTVDAVSRDFAYDLGTGYCGKRQLAKVDGGGPYLRCKAIVGGVQ